MPYSVTIGAVDQNYDLIGYMHNDKSEIEKFCQDEDPKVISNIQDRINTVLGIQELRDCGLVSK